MSEQDTREKLEAWAHEEIAEKWAQGDREVTMIMDDLHDLLDRQAAITSAEWCLSNDALEDELKRKKAEVAELRAELETYRKYADQGECEKPQSEENSDTREKLEADIAAWASKDKSIPLFARTVIITYDHLLDWLDRQAAITKAECEDDAEFDCMTCFRVGFLQQDVDRLTAERDELRRERNAAIGRASYMESAATEELAKLLDENDTIEVYDDKIHGKRRLVTGTQRKLEKQIAEMQEAIDAMGNGQFYAMYCKVCAERDALRERLEAIRAALHDKPGT